MLPTIFEFEFNGRSLAINGYGLMIGLGLVLWSALTAREAARCGHPLVARTMTMTMIVFVTSLYVGGKGLHLLTTIGRPEDIGDAQAGFVFFGALLLAIPAMTWRAKSLGLGALEGLDLFAIAAPAGHAFGRVGCFLAGCCYGHRCDQPWAVVFTRGKGLNEVPLHPVQLYEAFGLAVLYFVVRFAVVPRKRFDGQILLCYLIGYSALRVVTEMFRGDPERRVLFASSEPMPGEPPNGIPTSVAIAAVVTLVSVIVLVRLLRRARAADAPAS